MGDFTIELPENKIGHVLRSNVKKVEFLHSYDVGSREQISESGPKYTMMGFKYTITVSGDNTESEYCLYKSQNGEWYNDHEGKIQLEDDRLLIIKNAIIEKEKESKNTNNC